MSVSLLIPLFFATLCASARSAHAFELDSHRIETSAGCFVQQGASLVSGGMFWNPAGELGVAGLSWGPRLGAWVLSDASGAPGLGPVGALELSRALPWLELAASAHAGAGYAFGADHPFLETGIALDRRLGGEFLGVSGVGVQYGYLLAAVDTQFIGAHIGWRW